MDWDIFIIRVTTLYYKGDEMTNLECKAVVDEELSRLQDIQRLLQALVEIFHGDIDSLGLDSIIPPKVV